MSQSGRNGLEGIGRVWKASSTETTRVWEECSTKARQAQFQQKEDEMRGQEDATVLKLVRSGLCPSVSDCIEKDETSLYQRFDVVLKICYCFGENWNKLKLCNLLFAKVFESQRRLVLRMY